MKNTIPTQPESPENSPPAKTTEKDFNIYLAIGKFLIIGVSVIAILFTAKAAITDMTLESLEKNHASALTSYAKQEEASDQANKAAQKANEAKQAAADLACDTFRTLKAYKESKKLPLKNESNPCVDLKAPQEGF